MYESLGKDFRPYCKNPFLVFAYDYIPKILPKSLRWLSSIIFGIFLIIPSLVVMYYHGLLYEMFEEGIQPVVALIMLPIGLFFLWYIYKNYENTFKLVRPLAKINEKKYNEFLDENKKLFQNKFQYFLIIIFLIGLLSTQIYGYIHGESPVTHIAVENIWVGSIETFIVANIFNTIAGIVAITICWHLISLILIIWKFCKFPLQLRPLDPDGAAGLKPVAKLTYSMSLMCLLATPVLAYSVFIAGENILEVGFLRYTLIGFVIMMIIVFFFPLIKAHGVMLDTKEEIKKDLSDQHYKSFLTIKKDMSKSGYKISEPSLNNLLGISELYEKAEQMPIWPFDVTIITKFFATIIIPLLLIFGGEYVTSDLFSEPDVLPEVDIPNNFTIPLGNDLTFYLFEINSDPSIKNIVTNNISYTPQNFSLVGNYTCKNGNIILVEWDFEGDGLYDWQRNLAVNWPDDIDNMARYQARYRYDKTGKYVAIVKVTNEKGKSNTDSCIIRVI